jgi:hypothetical protein
VPTINIKAYYKRGGGNINLQTVFKSVLANTVAAPHPSIRSTLPCAILATSTCMFPKNTMWKCILSNIVVSSLLTSDAYRFLLYGLHYSSQSHEDHLNSDIFLDSKLSILTNFFLTAITPRGLKFSLRNRNQSYKRSTKGKNES